MSVTTTAPTASPRLWLRVWLIIIAAIEVMAKVTDLPALFHDYHHQTALLKFAQAVTSVKLAVAPLIAGAALFCAISGRLRYAILALAALVLVVWLDDLTSIPIHGLELSPDIGGLIIFINRFVFPLLAGAAIALALRGQRLELAGLLVSVPTIFFWSMSFLFFVSLLIYGF